LNKPDVSGKNIIRRPSCVQINPVDVPVIRIAFPTVDFRKASIIHKPELKIVSEPVSIGDWYHHTPEELIILKQKCIQALTGCTPDILPFRFTDENRITWQHDRIAVKQSIGEDKFKAGIA
jgi:hypothetical protein